MNTKKWFARPVFYVVMGLFIVWTYTVLGYGDKAAAFFYPEDHFFENVQFIILVVAGGLTLYAFWLAYKNRQALRTHWIKLAAYLALALFFFFIAGEEISWGQRIFNIATPESIAEVNAQQETNLHNLDIFEYSDYFSFDRLFTYFWLGFAVIVPMVSLFWNRFREFAGKYIPINYWAMGLLFLLNYAFVKISKIIYGGIYAYSEIPLAQAIKQTKELNYYLLLACLSAYFIWQLKQQIAAKSAEG